MQDWFPNLLLAVFLPNSLASPVILVARSGNKGNANGPLCFYDFRGNAVCHGGTPNFDWCDWSIDIVCTTLAGLSAIDVDPYDYSTGDGMDHTKDCFAQANNGKHGRAPLDYNVCKQQFEELKGCGAPGNSHFDANCIGGNINLYNVNDLYAGHAIDESKPSFSLGSVDAYFSGQGHTIGPAPGPLKFGTSEDAGPSDRPNEAKPAAINSKSSGTAASGAAGKTGRGSTTGGYLGSNPER